MLHNTVPRKPWIFWAPCPLYPMFVISTHDEAYTCNQHFFNLNKSLQIWSSISWVHTQQDYLMQDLTKIIEHRECFIFLLNLADLVPFLNRSCFVLIWSGRNLYGRARSCQLSYGRARSCQISYGRARSITSNILYHHTRSCQISCMVVQDHVKYLIWSAKIVLDILHQISSAIRHKQH